MNTTSSAMLTRLSRKLVEYFQRKTIRPPFTPELVLACHFFGDHSPFGFWDDQQLDRVPEQLERVKKDGFNTIILVIPFEPFISEPPKARLNPWYWDRLGEVLDFAGHAQIGVLLRLGYPHSTSPDNNAYLVERQMKWFASEQTEQWLSTYFRKVADTVLGRAAYRGYFLAWEDFWIVYDHPSHLTEAQRREIATSVNLAGLAESWRDDEQLRTLLGPQTALWPTQVVPTKNTPDHALWIKWFDNFLVNVVGGYAKTALPNVAFEVRSDAAAIDVNGKIFWAKFEMLRGTSSRRYGYWGVFYGALNQGEVLTAEQALLGFNYYLDVMNGPDASADLVIEQFNIIDNTLVFAGTNARLDPEELPHFLELATPLITRRTSGYGLWTYRNYRENWLSNSAFQRGLDGWVSTHDSTIIQESPRSKAWIELTPTATLTQSIFGMLRLQAPIARYPAFNVLIDAKFLGGQEACHADFSVSVGETIAIPDSGLDGRLRFTLPREAVTEGISIFVVKNVSALTLRISNLSLFAYEQIGGLYDADGIEQPMSSLIRKFNADISYSFSARTSPS